MLSTILSKSDCAECKFCCSFKRTSLWETPVFEKESAEKLRSLFPRVKFVPVAGSSDSFTYDISTNYKTTDPAEEVPCPFLDKNQGCILPPQDKPFDCKIWPLRAVKLPPDAAAKTDLPAVALTPTCPAINRQPLQKVCELLQKGLGKTIVDYAVKHPDIIKEYSEFLSTIVFKP